MNYPADGWRGSRQAPMAASCVTSSRSAASRRRRLCALSRLKGPYLELLAIPACLSGPPESAAAFSTGSSGSDQTGGPQSVPSAHHRSTRARLLMAATAFGWRDAARPGRRGVTREILLRKFPLERRASEPPTSSWDWWWSPPAPGAASRTAHPRSRPARHL